MATLPLRQQFSPWSVIDDDGEFVLALNAHPDRRPVRLYKSGEATQRILNLSYDPDCDEDWAIAQSMIDIGVLLDPATGAAALPVSMDDGGNRLAPYLGGVELEVDSAGSSQTQLRELIRVLYILLSTRTVEQITIKCADIRSVQEFNLLRGHVAREVRSVPNAAKRVNWVLELSSLELVAQCEPLLSEDPHLGLFVVDAWDLEGHSDRDAALKQVELIARQGHIVRPTIYTRSQAGLQDTVVAWQQATEHAGLSIRLAVLDAQMKNGVNALQTPEEFAVAQEELLSLPRLLLSALHRSEPWGTLIRGAVLPGVRKQGGSKRHSTLFLTKDGSWARSRYHAQTHFIWTFEALSSRMGIMPMLVQSGTSENVLWPDCAACAFAPLCDGYWSPEQDVLQRLGLKLRAKLLADLHCAIRKDLLFQVLAEIRACYRPRESGRRSQAAFMNGQLTIAERAST